MNIFNKLKEINAFQPLELNEENISKIFDECLSDNPDTNISKRSLPFSTVAGFPENQCKEIYFYKDKLQKNEKKLKYLFGQLSYAGSETPHATINQTFFNYAEEQWTQNKASFLKLLYLGNAVHYFAPVEKDHTSFIFAKDDIIPTLSPNDPSFPEWWEEHKTEWEGE